MKLIIKSSLHTDLDQWSEKVREKGLDNDHIFQHVQFVLFKILEDLMPFKLYSHHP